MDMRIPIYPRLSSSGGIIIFQLKIVKNNFDHDFLNLLIKINQQVQPILKISVKLL